MFHLSKADAVRKIIIINTISFFLTWTYLGIFASLRAKPSNPPSSYHLSHFLKAESEMLLIVQKSVNLMTELLLNADQELLMDSDVLPHNFHLSGILQGSILTGK